MILLFGTSTTITLILAILGGIVLLLLIVFVVVLIAMARRANIVLKKVDYLVEDFTYKAELLNSTVELIDKFSKYADSFDAIFKGNSKSGVKWIFKNKNLLYYGVDKFKEFMGIIDDDQTKKSKDKGEKK